jgi:hypothetical protein
MNPHKLARATEQATSGLSEIATNLLESVGNVAVKKALHTLADASNRIRWQQWRWPLRGRSCLAGSSAAWRGNAGGAGLASTDLGVKQPASCQVLAKD